jgi:hypothetical protein
MVDGIAMTAHVWEQEIRSQDMKPECGKDPVTTFSLGDFLEVHQLPHHHTEDQAFYT